MKNTSFGGFPDADSFVDDKITKLKDSDRTFRAVYSLMIREADNIFCEITDGYSVTSTTYGQFAERTAGFADCLSVLRTDYAQNSIIGLYMNNREEWPEIFWALLMNGFRPFLMNTRLPKDILEQTLREQGVCAVVSEEEPFCVRTILLDDLKQAAAADSAGPLPGSDSAWADEILLMSSGTSEHVKVCAYTGENIYYQICDSGMIIKTCKEMKKHYEGRLKHLAFLPFYHIFGLFAVYMWFSFFSRTFVFLKNFAPDTILNTVRRLKVTHIFAVPILWNTVYASAMKEIRRQGEKTVRKFEKGLALSEKLSSVPGIGNLFVKKAFREVRDRIFGESICFMISGGGAVSEDVLRFFNGIGYHLANGYGMTEVGITSVELSGKRRHLTDGATGMPLSSLEYRISPESELLIRGRSAAERITAGADVIPRDQDGWYHTGDLAREEGGRYFILGRQDDVIIGQNGENLNPDILESGIHVDGVKDLCLTGRDTENGTVPVLVLSISPYEGVESRKRIRRDAAEALKKNGLSSAVGEIYLTVTPLMGREDFKVNRRVIRRRLAAQELVPAETEEKAGSLTALELRVRDMFASVLEYESSGILPDADFFHDLGGTSLAYFSLAMALEEEFGVKFPADAAGSYSTVRTVSGFISKERYE